MMMNEHQGCSGKSKVAEDTGGSEPKSRIWPHHFHISPEYVSNMEKVFSIVRKICDRKPTDKLKDLDVKTAIWSIPGVVQDWYFFTGVCDNKSTCCNPLPFLWESG